MNHVSANNEYHIPLHVKPVQSKKGGVINTKVTQLSGEILPQRKLPRTVTLRNISSEIGLIKYIFDVASFEEDLTNRV